MNLIETIFSIKERKRTTDYDKIRVTSNGAFYMDSKDIFDDKDKSLKLIKNLSNAVHKYKSVNSKLDVAESKIKAAD